MPAYDNNIRRIAKPYTPGEQPKERVIKLNTNENPYPPSPAVLSAMQSLSGEDFRKYPDPQAFELIDEIAKTFGVERECVFPGVGSDDVLAVCFLTFFNGNLPILFPDITYSFYPVWAELFGIPYRQCPLTSDFKINKEDYYAQNGGIIFPNPNAPVSVYEPLSFIEDIVSHNPASIVIVDEAYIDFAGESAIALTKKYDNLLVVQTFSKSRSMCGIRIGYAIGAPQLIKYLNDVKYSFNSYTLGTPSIKAGVAALRDSAYSNECINKIIATRKRAKSEFNKLGFIYPEPSGNFLFVTHPEIQAKKLFEDLKKAKIYVRYWDTDRIRDYLRITVGTDEEMEALFAFLREYIPSQK
ncbi:MAG: aminotransferase class I/II-fold pyridoxal phosphate-dependent enzyme [Lachnospiraceae bacterium]|jgi:histidinol-phosphate aminotransferase|nr:aminotransferase class I/II-fold pyridoxal phosphate-dependent enzyme [Lachnospiraceae bacterium]